MLRPDVDDPAGDQSFSADGNSKRTKDFSLVDSQDQEELGGQGSEEGNSPSKEKEKLRKTFIEDSDDDDSEWISKRSKLY